MPDSSVILPLLIFIARIGDVSIGTIRVVMVIRDRKLMAAILGFFEVIIWVAAVSAVLSTIKDNWINAVAYAGGFATGNYIGMLLENWLAIGNVMVRVVNTKPEFNLTKFLRDQKYIVTQLDANGINGKAELCFIVISRSKEEKLLKLIMEHCPTAFISTNDVEYSSSKSGIFQDMPSHLPLWKRLTKFR